MQVLNVCGAEFQHPMHLIFDAYKNAAMQTVVDVEFDSDCNSVTNHEFVVYSCRAIFFSANATKRLLFTIQCAYRS